MHYLAIALMLTAQFVWAEPASVQYDPVQFEKRFNKADKDNKGKLSRKEAYGEFPRMPEFFDEIDTDKDGFITLKEVNSAMERRVNAAINASQPVTRYGKVDAGKDATTGIEDSAKQQPVFTSEGEERRYRRYEFYEAIGDDKAKALERGEPVPTTPTSPILVKPF
jgi:EF hand